MAPASGGGCGGGHALLVTTTDVLLFAHAGRYKLRASLDKLKSRLALACLLPGRRAQLLLLLESGALVALSLPRLEVQAQVSLDLDGGFRALRRCSLQHGSLVRALASGTIVVDTVLWPQDLFPIGPPGDRASPVSPGASGAYVVPSGGFPVPATARPWFVNCGGGFFFC